MPSHQAAPLQSTIEQESGPSGLVRVHSDAQGRAERARIILTALAIRGVNDPPTGVGAKRPAWDTYATPARRRD